MGKFVDRTGLRYGRLLVQGFAGYIGNGVKRNSHWRCTCDCGTEKVVSSSALTQGDTRSCGCLHLELKRARLTRHGGAPATGRSREYRIWQGVVQRCTNPRDAAFNAYGGKGIRVCAEWLDFAAFIEDMGHAPSSKHTLDRIDGRGDYEPGNCRWATRLEQNYNRFVTVWITFNGRTLPMMEWSRETGINYRTLRHRLAISGWTPERALTQPVRGARQ